MPTWRRRQLRQALEAVAAEARQGIAGPDDEHRALRHVRARNWPAVARPSSRAGRSVVTGARGEAVVELVDALLAAGRPPSIAALHRSVASELRARGFPAPRRWRFMRWLVETGRHHPVRRGRPRGEVD